MNKYEKQYKKLEKRSCVKSAMQKYFLTMKMIRKWNSKYQKKLYYESDLFNFLIFYLSEVPDEFALWIKEEILPKLNISFLIEEFLMELSYQAFEEDKTNQKKLMNSIKKAGLVKDISYDEEKEGYCIVMLDGKNYLIKQAIKDDKEQALKCNHYCHFYTEEALKHIATYTNDGIDFSGCCVLFYDLFNNPHYHSYIVRDSDNVVIDYAHNIARSFDFCIEELKHEILLKQESDKILKGIDNLKAVDSEFNKSKKNDFLKYVMNSQITRKK